MQFCTTRKMACNSRPKKVKAKGRNCIMKIKIHELVSQKPLVNVEADEPKLPYTLNKFT